MAIVCIILVVLMNAAGAGSQGEISPVSSTVDVIGADTLFQVGEELTYNVSYAIFDVGQIRIKVLERMVQNGHPAYHAIAYIDSYKGIPFVNLHVTYESAVTDSLFSVWFRARNKEEARWRTIVYNFDYQAHKIFITSGYLENIPEKRDTVQLDTVTQDGLSLFFYARANVHDRKKVDVPTVVNEKNVTTTLNLLAERTSEKIDAVDYPIDLVHFEGEANFVGVFGLTGGLEGWFSNDDSAVPVLAKMKVLIGNIRIELMRWNRGNWVPPRSPS